MATVNVTVSGKTTVYESGTTIKEIAAKYQDEYKYDILLASSGSKLRELNHKVKKNCELKFMTYEDKCGLQCYKRTATLLMLKAFHDVVGQKNIRNIYVDFSIGKGTFCKVDIDLELTDELVNKIKNRMEELVAEDVPITKRSLDTEDAVKLFGKLGMHSKEKLFKYRRDSKANLYSLNGFEDYFYGYMLPSTGYIKYFDLFRFHDGVVLQVPNRTNPNNISQFEQCEKLFNTLIESSKWIDMIHVGSVGELNNQIVNGNIGDIMLVAEALQEKKIADIAETIASENNKKFIMIAGPSSSGKTTFSHRLTIQLMAHGLTPHPIPVDDYFVDRTFTPKDKDGNLNYECLEAIDVEQFNKDMMDLASGIEVELPEYNFITGKREYKGKKLKLGPDDILVIEGIHGLNDKLSYKLPKEKKYKIYISALTALNIDEHNRISTTDARLIRRLVRDFKTRGASAQKTISMWPSVRRGEEQYIFPYQESADVMFNSALVYELAALKQYAEPLLFTVPIDSDEYIEAKRLLKFLDYFLGCDTENIPKNSLVREFVGGGCFNI